MQAMRGRIIARLIRQTRYENSKEGSRNSMINLVFPKRNAGHDKQTKVIVC